MMSVAPFYLYQDLYGVLQNQVCVKHNFLLKVSRLLDGFVKVLDSHPHLNKSNEMILTHG
ncbi:hypothetical protein BK708_39505 [Bacillus thuringiensis serovar yunnanensis]|nr:hypothetical protein BK708_39505 [Bacillus thuringiensis serovar yunnanensis]